MGMQLPQQSHGRQPSPPTDDPPLHPKIRSIVSLALAHTQKTYFSGPLIHKFERNPDGKPHKDEGWREVWAQLSGTTLCIWDMEEVKIANQQGREVPPVVYKHHGSRTTTQPGTEASPPRKYTNVTILNTVGMNHRFFSCPSSQDAFPWTAAVQLSFWEKARLAEINTAHLFRINLDYGRDTPSSLVYGRLEGQCRVRVVRQAGWVRSWVLFSRGKSDGLPERATISLHSAQRGKDKRKALLTFDTATQAFAVYPEQPKLISSSALIKLEGTYGDEDMCANMKHREGWMLLMPDLEGVQSANGEALKWLIVIYDVFRLYGRPGVYTWDPRDAVSMMHAYPIGPKKQPLFLDREAAVLDPNEERTSVVRSKLVNIIASRLAETLAERVRGGLSPRENQTEDSARPLPPPGGEGTLIPIGERSTLNSSSWDAGTDTSPLQSPLLSIPNQLPVVSTLNQRPVFSAPRSSPSQSDKIQKQQSETRQSSPKLQTDGVLGEPLVTSSTSHTPPHDSGVDQEGSVESGEHRSSFAPSKRLLKRIARSRAQKAARRAVIRRPGRSVGANGGSRKSVHRGSWGKTSDEAEGGEDADDESIESGEKVYRGSWREAGDEAEGLEGKDGENVDSDNDPVAPKRDFGKLFTPGSPYDFTADSNQAERARPHTRSLRPPPLSRLYGIQQGPDVHRSSTFCHPTGQLPGPTRDRSSDGRRPSPQPHGRDYPRSPPDFGPQKEDFVDTETVETVTKGFGAKTLCYTDLQGLRETPTERQKEDTKGIVTKGIGPPALNILREPPPQIGYLDTVSTHEYEKKREDSLGPVAPGSPSSTAATSVVESDLDTLSVWRLIRREFTMSDRASLIESVFSSKNGIKMVRGLQEDDAQSFVDVIDEALLSLPDLSPPIRKKCLRSLYKTCGRHALLPTAMKVLAHYDRTGSALYRGGFADVWKGDYRGREVAVKVIRTYTKSDLQKVIGRFCKEVVTWRTLRHPNILPLIGVMMTESQFAMISDWMENGSINEFVQANPDADRLGLLGDVARGLIYIHSQVMIHGDLKGANILIDQAGHARLADFGLLTIISDPANLLSSSSYTQGGTARWMSPELINPRRFGIEKSCPTKSSDCYAFGMVIYETISGHLPFHKYNDLAVLVKVLEGERPLREPGFADSLWEMLEQCWTPQPDIRPSVQDILQCLEGASHSWETPSPEVNGGAGEGDDWDSEGESSEFENSDHRDSHGGMVRVTLSPLLCDKRELRKIGTLPITLGPL